MASQQVLSQIDELLDYLHATTDAIQEQENQLREMTRRRKLEELRHRAEGIRGRIGGALHGVGEVAEEWGETIHRMWDEAKTLTSEGAKNVWDKLTPERTPVTDTWAGSFGSREWREFFARHPNLDPEQWKQYFRSSMIDPKEWKRVVEQALPSSWIEDQQGQTAAKKPLLGYPSLQPSPAYRPGGQEWYKARGTVGGGVYGGVPAGTPVSLFYSVIFGVYFMLLLGRMVKSRRTTGVYVGDGTSELLMTIASPMGAATSTTDQADTARNMKDAMGMWRPCVCLIYLMMYALAVLSLVDLHPVTDGFSGDPLHIESILPTLIYVRPEPTHHGRAKPEIS